MSYFPWGRGRVEQKGAKGICGLADNSLTRCSPMTALGTMELLWNFLQRSSDFYQKGAEGVSRWGPMPSSTAHKLLLGHWSPPERDFHVQ